MTWLARSNWPAATRRCSGLGEGSIEESLLAISRSCEGTAAVRASGGSGRTENRTANSPQPTESQVTTPAGGVKMQGAFAAQAATAVGCRFTPPAEPALNGNHGQADRPLGAGRSRLVCFSVSACKVAALTLVSACF